MKLFRWPNIVITLVLTTMIIGFTYRYFANKKGDELMKHTYSTTAIVEYYGSGMGHTLIHYKYRYKNTWYEGAHYTRAEMINQIPVGTRDLQIECAVDAPELSRIVDKRFE